MSTKHFLAKRIWLQIRSFGSLIMIVLGVFLLFDAVVSIYYVVTHQAGYWRLVIPLIVLAAIAEGIYLSRFRRCGAGQCQRCGYDTRTTPFRCPECGYRWTMWKK